MAQGLGINEVIDIDTTISSGGIGPAEFGAGLLLVNESTVLAGAGSKKIRRFNSLSAVEGAFDDATIRREAAIWFAADPSPKALYIARVVETDTPTEGFSAPLTQTTLTKLDGISDGSMSINGHGVVGISPNGATGAALASILQTRVQAAHSSLSTSTVTYDTASQRLHFTLQGASNAAVTAPMEVTNYTSGTAIATDLGFIGGASAFEEGTSDEVGAYYRQGHVGEGVAEALSEVIGFASNGRPTNIMVSDNVSDSIAAGSPSGKIAALRGFAQGGDYITAFVETGEATVFSDNTVRATGSQIGIANGANQGKVMAIYSEPSTTGTSDRRIDIAVLAKLSAQDFDQPQSIITLVPKSLPGVSPSNNVTSGQVRGLENANASVYTTVGGYPSFLGGRVSNGTWADAQYWLAWLKNEMERNLYNAIRQSNRLSNIELTDTIHKVMAKAINSGGVKLGGVVNTAMKKEIRIVTNNPGFDGVLQNGYLMWIQPYSGLTDIDRADRHQSFKVWVSPSEAIHSIEGTIVLSG